MTEITTIMAIAGALEMGNWLQSGSDSPGGGFAKGVGLTIHWQDGPIDREHGEVASGAFIEDVLLALINRMEFFQRSPMYCQENERILYNLRSAYDEAMQRRRLRAGQGVLGKNIQHDSYRMPHQQGMEMPTSLNFGPVIKTECYGVNAPTTSTGEKDSDTEAGQSAEAFAKNLKNRLDHQSVTVTISVTEDEEEAPTRCGCDGPACKQPHR